MTVLTNDPGPYAAGQAAGTLTLPPLRAVLAGLTDDDHVEGPADAAITIIQYGDFQCPACVDAYRVMARIRRHFARDLRIVFRHFPLKAHPQAQLAAEATEAAYAQAGDAGFWTMHDAILLQSPDRLTEQDLVALADRFGLDAPRLGRELANGSHTARVRRDLRSGARANVRGTPTFFVNGLPFDGNWREPMSFAKAIRKLARRANEAD